VTVEGVGGTGALGGVVSLTSSGLNFCALLISGGVDCWGFNGSYGNLGDGTFNDSAVPEAVVGLGGTGTLSGVAALAGDGEGYCALLTSGSVYCWGEGQHGNLGNGTFYSNGSAVPVAVNGVGGTGTLTGVKSLIGYGDGFCALLGSSQVACWGRSEFGQLGDGSFNDSAVPTLVAGVGGTGTLTGVASVVNGLWSECAVLNSGGVDCWGRGNNGQLGNGTVYTTGNTGSAVPVAVEGVGGTGTLTGVAKVIGANATFCAVLASSGVDCWGWGNYGQLGDGIFYTTGNQGSAVPVAVEGVGGTGTLGGVMNLVWHSWGWCALLSSKGADCWGYGEEGALGDGSFNDSAVPVTVAGLGNSGTLTDIASIASGGDAYCATFTSNGGLDCWGNGATGQLGDGLFYSTGNQGSPVPVAAEGP
jgi:alpha-tubulin suppressor-like RCC1 family protein